MKNEKFDYPIVYIEWEDSYSVNTGWDDLEDILSHCKDETFSIHQTGYLIHEDEKALVLANQLNSTLEGAKFSGIHRIPKGCLIKKNIICPSSLEP